MTFPCCLFAQTINLNPGDSVPNNTVIPSGTTVNVLGGTIGLGVDLSNGVLNVESGNVALGASSIATGFTNSNNQVNISGGSVGGFFQLTDSTDLTLTGGGIESFGVFGNGTTANISGGTVSRFPDIFSGGVVDISGGDVFAIRVFSGGEVNLFGTEFALDGVTLDLTVGDEFVINQRNVNLSGILADGSPIETDLNTSFGGFFSSNPDGAATGARVTVTAVSGEVDGDFNDDGVYDCADINELTGDAVAGSNSASFDLTGDGLVDAADVDAWLLEAGEVNIGPGRSFLGGDADLDGFVDVSDFNIWNENRFTASVAWCDGDFNVSGGVDVSDFNIWNENRFMASDAVPVPEPGGVILLMIGLLTSPRWRALRFFSRSAMRHQ